MSTVSNREALPVWPGLQVVRSGRRAVVVAVGPMLSPVLDGLSDRKQSSSLEQPSTTSGGRLPGAAGELR